MLLKTCYFINVLFKVQMTWQYVVLEGGACSCFFSQPNIAC